MAKTKYGYCKCERCGERVVVKVNERDTLSYTCGECDFSPYTKKTDAGYKQFEAKIDRVNVEPPAPAAPPAPKGPAPKPSDKPAPAAADKMPWMR